MLAIVASNQDQIVGIGLASGPLKHQGFGEGSAGMTGTQKSSVSVDSATWPPCNLDRTRAADLVVEKIEPHVVANGEVIERKALAHVAPVEEDFPIVRQPDEPVALADEQRHDSARFRCALPFRRPAPGDLASRRRLSDGASSARAHATSGAPADDATGHRRNRRRCAPLLDGPRSR